MHSDNLNDALIRIFFLAGGKGVSYIGHCALHDTRVSQFRFKKSFASKRNLAKQKQFRFVSLQFRETTEIKFRFVSLCFAS